MEKRIKDYDYRSTKIRICIPKGCSSIVSEIPRFKSHFSIHHVLTWHPLLNGDIFSCLIFGAMKQNKKKLFFLLFKMWGFVVVAKYTTAPKCKLVGTAYAEEQEFQIGY